MRWFLSILVVLVLVAGLWWMEQRRQAELRPEAEVDIAAEPALPEPRHPLPKAEVNPLPSTDDGGDAQSGGQAEVEPLPPLPDLAESDEAALEALSALFGNDFVRQWVKPEFVISRSVAVINSLDGEAPALKTRPLEAPNAEWQTEEIEEEETLLWTEANSQRYDTLVDTLESVPPETAAALYARHYPLFQQAWEELGETEPHFNDRLIDIIEHLLASPEVALPFEVTPHEGRLHFADESLQGASWGHKLLIRTGTEHARKIKEWLRQFRTAVTGNEKTAYNNADWLLMRWGTTVSA